MIKTVFRQFLTRGTKDVICTRIPYAGYTCRQSLIVFLSMKTYMYLAHSKLSNVEVITVRHIISHLCILMCALLYVCYVGG